jgi:hypothetical protein
MTPQRLSPPVVVCMGKETLFAKIALHARERAMSLLAVDLPGSGTGAEFDEIVDRPDLESAVDHVLDYLMTRSDVDKDADRAPW